MPLGYRRSCQRRVHHDDESRRSRSGLVNELRENEKPLLHKPQKINLNPLPDALNPKDLGIYRSKLLPDSGFV